MNETRAIAVDNLVIDTAQSRQGDWDGDEADRRLVNSIQREGLLQPLVVRPVEYTPYGDEVQEEFAIIAGSRRYHAAVAAGLETVACRVTAADDFEAAVVSLRENEERKPLADHERAESLRLQFELIRPDPTLPCPVCDEIQTRDGMEHHWQNTDHGPVSPTSGPDRKLPEMTFYTDMQAKEYLATRHFGDEATVVKRLENYLNMADLPETLRALWAPPDQRSEQAAAQLEQYDLSRTLGVSGSSKLGESVVSFYNRVAEAIADDAAISAEEATLEAVCQLDHQEIGNDRLTEEIRKLTSETVTNLESVEATEQATAFTDTVISQREDLHREIAELNAPPKQVKFSFAEQRYRRWHARVKMERGIESNAQVAREAYRQYLEQMADKHGWVAE